MNHPKYRAWRDKNSDIASMLWVQGPLGYGKTVLSSFIIDDLKTLSFHTNNEDGNVVYFHFDRLSPDHKEPQHALRAILNQIVHTLQKYQDVVDGLTLLMDVGGTGQQFASEGDTATALSFVLHRYPNLTLLFDGLDECSDSATLLLKLFAIYGNSAVRIIILSRPEVALPNIWIEAATSIRLGDRENSISIERFVKPRVEQLIESDLLPSGVSTDYLVSTISSRANSLFLWAKLMMIYLECPALSRRARLQTINERNLLEGLDEMYSRIIDLIRNKLKPQREAAFKTFQWLVAAYRPLHFSELQAALAIRLGQATDADEDYIINFQQSLVSICGSLVYVQNDGTVQFIHLSVMEFLTRKPAVQEDTTPGIFQVDTSMAHFFVASSCLSYLRYDVPGHPLSGSSKVDPNKKVVREKLPLLCYSIDWWKNGLEGFTLLRDSFQIAFPLMANVFVPLARQFLDTKPTVTVWVEAIWTFSKTPPLLLLADHIAVFDKMLPVISRQKQSSQLQTILQLGADIAELDTDLSHLDGEWGRVLRDHPTEVWEPSINAFHCSRFLVRTDASNIAWVATTCSKASEDTIPAVSATANFSANEIILLSDVSNDGSTLGSIRLIPSPAFLRVRAQLQSVTDTDSDDGDDDDVWSSSKASNSNISSSTDDLSRSEMAKRSALADSVSPGWRVRCILDSMGPRISSDQDSIPIINFELPSEQVFNMLMMSFHDMDPSRLLIPVSFSPDLRKMAILQSVVEVSNHGYRLQHLDEDALKQANRCIREKPSRLQCVDPQLSKTMWQQSVFSPNGQVFAVFQSGEEPGQDGDIEYFDCTILIYSNDQSGSHSKRWRKINEKGPFDQVSGVKKPLVFHPVQKALVVIADDKTYLWNFERSSTLSRDYLENSTFKELYPRPLDDITFTDSGKYLFGVCDEYGTVRFTMPAGLLDANDHPQQSVGPIQAEETRITRHSQESAADLVASQVHAQGPLDLSLSWVGDTVQHTALHQYRNDSIVLTNLSIDGLERSAMLLRIPESVSEIGVSPTLLDPQGDSPVIRLVVNKAAQTKYDLMQNQSVVLPLIVERQKSTIETHLQTLHHIFAR